MPEQVKDKHDEPIKKGDEVYTRIRGGRHEGEVDKIVTSQAQAEKEGVKNPPKVGSSAIPKLPALPVHFLFLNAVVV